MFKNVHFAVISATDILYKTKNIISDAPIPQNQRHKWCSTALTQSHPPMCGAGRAH